jgi:hypothetical protein
MNKEKMMHGHTYYLVGIIAAVLSILCLVEGIIFQIDEQIYIAALLYFLAVGFAVIMHRSTKRGRLHYKYPGKK